VQALQTSLKNARSAFKTASEKAPPFITRSPWFKGLTSSMNPHLSKDAGNSSAAAQAAAEAVCPENCLNLNALTGVFAGGRGSSMQGSSQVGTAIGDSHHAAENNFACACPLCCVVPVVC
jgi:hypothetical protein